MARKKTAPPASVLPPPGPDDEEVEVEEGQEEAARPAAEWVDASTLVEWAGNPRTNQPSDPGNDCPEFVLRDDAAVNHGVVVRAEGDEVR